MTQVTSNPLTLGAGQSQGAAALGLPQVGTGAAVNPFLYGGQTQTGQWAQPPATPTTTLPGTPASAGLQMGQDFGGPFTDQSGQPNWQLMSSVLGYDAYQAYTGYLQNWRMANAGRGRPISHGPDPNTPSLPSPTDWFGASLQSIDPAGQVMSLLDRAWTESQGTAMPTDLRENILAQINGAPGLYRQILLGMSSNVMYGQSPQTIANYLYNYTALGPTIGLYTQQHPDAGIGTTAQAEAALDQQFVKTLGRHLNPGEYQTVHNMDAQSLQRYMEQQPYKSGATLTQWNTALTAGQQLYERAYGKAPDDNTVSHWLGMTPDQITDQINSGHSVIHGLNVGQYLGYHDALQSEWQKNYGTASVPADVIQQFHDAQQATR